MQMRPSRVLARLRAGQVACSFKTNLSDARVAEIAGMAGFDCLWTCMEHVGTDWTVIEQQVWAAKTRDMDVMVRVARGPYSDYVLPLELDAAGIMVPHVMSLADAQAVVRMTRFHPIGRRPVDGGNADGAYCWIPTEEYMRQANEQRFVAIQIEDPEPLGDLEEIAKLPGIDIIFFGPADFTHGLGIPGRFDDPRVEEARRRIVEVCQQHGKIPGTVASVDNLEHIVGMGFRFLNLGADVVGLGQYCRDLAGHLDRVRRPS